MRLFINALWSPAGKELTSWLLFVMSNCEGVFYFPIGIQGQVWCFIVSIPYIRPIAYFYIGETSLILLSETTRPRVLILVTFAWGQNGPVFRSNILQRLI